MAVAMTYGAAAYLESGLPRVLSSNVFVQLALIGGTQKRLPAHHALRQHVSASISDQSWELT